MVNTFSLFLSQTTQYCFTLRNNPFQKLCCATRKKKKKKHSRSLTESRHLMAPVAALLSRSPRLPSIDYCGNIKHQEAVKYLALFLLIKL